MKPFVKWVGGKTRVLSQLLPLFPKQIGTFYEPFVGGGAVFFSLAEQNRFERAVINDWNADLMETFRIVRDFPDDLLKLLKGFETSYKTDPAALFQSWQKPSEALQKTLSQDPALRAARLIFLNKTCFNGLYRVNKKGEFNAPFGKYRNPRVHDEKTLRACSGALGGFVILKQGDFEKAVEGAKAGDCVYFDPPYVPLNVTSSFTSYTAEGFNLKEQQRLATVFRALMDRGVSVVASNSNTPIVRELYEGLELHEIQAPRAVNSQGDGRGKVSELVIIGRSAPRAADDFPKPQVVWLGLKRGKQESAPKDWQDQVSTMVGVQKVGEHEGRLKLLVTVEALCRLQGVPYARLELPIKHETA